MILTRAVGHLALLEGKKSMGKILAPNNVSPRESELNIVNLIIPWGMMLTWGTFFGRRPSCVALGKNELNLVNYFPV
jgi:hypothetical protein